MDKNKTSWGGVAKWYDKLLSEEGNYQKDLILPNLLRLMEIQKGEAILDLACGQGFFAREFFRKGAKVFGADISAELIEIARKNSPKEIKYEIVPADDLKFAKAKSFNKITIILAIQNIENVAGVFCECARVLKDNGQLFLVVNHPAFRVPKQSSWGFDPSTSSGQAPEIKFKNNELVMYRRVDQYLSESRNKIQMHPSINSQPTQGFGGQAGQVRVEDPNNLTISFHRPLQFYFKVLNKYGFSVTKLEEWNSNKVSQPGPRAKAEDIARKEIPLFLFLEAKRNE